MHTPDMKERLTSAGIDATGGPPGEFGEALSADIARGQKVVKAANIKTSD